jgi:hypothetical protein
MSNMKQVVEIIERCAEGTCVSRPFLVRADNKWHRYPPKPEVKTLAAALKVIHEDTHHCFFG